MSTNDNNLFYLCSLIECISRITCNYKADLVDIFGKKELEKIYNLADAYHTDNIQKTALELIEKFNIKMGNYERFDKHMPSVWDIGKVYQRLIKRLCSNENEYIDKLIELFKSWFIIKLDDYSNSLYYESPDYIYNCYKDGKILE